jgi:rhodanese-related sulfurtransferase
MTEVPLEPMTVQRLLDEARARIPRFAPWEAREAVERGAFLIDIRPRPQRVADGEVPGARIVSRNVLEWRLDPTCEHRDRDLARPGVTVIVMCQEGYQSSLAAATLRRLGVDAADLAGGFRAWLSAGLPITRRPQRP